GRISLGVLLVQDGVGAGVRTLVSGLGVGQGEGLTSVARGLLSAFLGIGVLAGAAAVAVRWILPPVLAWLKDSSEAVFIGALAWAFGFLVAAEMLHVSIELGAFIAGVALAQLPYNDELRRRVHPLVDFFLAVFFVALGAHMDLDAAGAFLWPALALSAFVLVGKPLIIAGLLARLGHSRRTAFLAGLTLGQISEFGFILAGLAVGVGILAPEMMSLVGLLGLITIGISAVLVPRGRHLHAALERRGWLDFLGGHEDVESPPETLRGHIVLVGMNTLGRILAQRFAAVGERVLAVDTDTDKLADLPAGTEVLFGSVDHPGVFHEAGIEHAKLVVSTLQIEDVNSLLAYRCARLGVPVSVHAFDPSLAHELLEIGADHLMISKHDGIRHMAEQLQRLGVMG
ncbi:MAG TPA: cation:proton antiporter, partial [Longimicrobiales bacterium]|nr:cation:proton antiporter [Longimicrobiales bacterium]